MDTRDVGVAEVPPPATDATPGRTSRRETAALVAALVIGLGLAAAPAVFQMFSRAPKGGDMLDGFRPYMTEVKVADFQGYLTVIDEGAVETADQVEPDAETTLDLDADGFAEEYAFVSDFEKQWPAIDADMSDMLDTMERNIDNYEAVDALPPFKLFPWFFVLPGLIAAGLAASILVSRWRGGSAGARVVILGVVGLGIVAAPAVFQMFTRAPEGKEMIDDFRPLMTEDKVATIQGYFLTIGGEEGQLRNDVLPDLATAQASDDPSGQYPAVDTFIDEWPTINNEFAPMIGAMSDNLENYAAVDALPPFSLFPWFFVIPGALIAGAAYAARPRRTAPAPDPTP
jgi:hypothetical protein